MERGHDSTPVECRNKDIIKHFPALQHFGERASTIEGLVKLCDSMVSYKSLLEKKLTKEVEKINTMQRMIHGEASKDISKKEYLHFVFTSGSQLEKSDILRQFGEKLVMKDKMPQIGE